MIRPRVGDLRQFASVRRIVLDDGPERGVRALAFSTGGGLDFWALLDRSLDIGPLWWRGLPIAWQSPAGFPHPSFGLPDTDGGFGVNRILSGLLVTCGLDHVRRPAAGHPMHGRLPSTPARLLGSGEDWQASQPVLHAEAEVVQYRLGGESIRLLRRISAPIGGRELTLHDTVTNDGSLPQVHDILYHFNLGHPGIADGTCVALNGAPLLGPLRLADPNGTGDARCIESGRSPVARAVVATPGSDTSALRIELEYECSTLPYMQVWQDLRPQCGLLAIEPSASQRRERGRSAGAVTLAPGESRDYRITLRIDGGVI